MATNATRTQNRTAVRPTYFDLGQDAGGAWHTYCTLTDEVHVVADGERELVQALEGRDIEDWMAFVAQERGWDDRQYGTLFGDVLGGALGSGA